MKKIGVLGGTFDPVHNGHLGLARDAAARAELDRVYFMPAKLQPFKLDQKISPEEDRIAMLNLACEEANGSTAGQDLFQVSTLEMELPGVSYTYRTLAELRSRIERSDVTAQIHFITGTDTYVKLDTWKEAETLLADNVFCVGHRPGYGDEELQEKMNSYERRFGTKTILVENTRMDISATQVREKVKSGQSIDGLVPDAVAEYIEQRGLYRCLSIQGE